VAPRGAFSSFLSFFSLSFSSFGALPAVSKMRLELFRLVGGTGAAVGGGKGEEEVVVAVNEEDPSAVLLLDGDRRNAEKSCEICFRTDFFSVVGEKGTPSASSGSASSSSLAAFISFGRGRLVRVCSFSPSRGSRDSESSEMGSRSGGGEGVGEEEGVVGSEGGLAGRGRDFREGARCRQETDELCLTVEEEDREAGGEGVDERRPGEDWPRRSSSPCA